MDERDQFSTHIDGIDGGRIGEMKNMNLLFGRHDLNLSAPSILIQGLKIQPPPVPQHIISSYKNKHLGAPQARQSCILDWINQGIVASTSRRD